MSGPSRIRSVWKRTRRQRWTGSILLFSLLALALATLGRGFEVWFLAAVLAAVLLIFVRQGGSTWPLFIRPSAGTIGRYNAARLILISAALMAAMLADGPSEPLTLLAGLPATILVAAESLVRPQLTRTDVGARNLPGVEPARIVARRAGLLVVATCAVTLLLAVSPVVPSTAVLVVAAALAWGTALGLTLTVRWLRKYIARARAAKWKGLREAAPEFAVYFSGTRDTAYQLEMWLPYLEEVGRPWAIILREGATLGRFASKTSMPVVVCSTLATLDRGMLASIGVVFYVNNSFKNSHCVRYNEKTHVQLLHGDSDKPASYSPVTAMYDKVFVAGQAGIDRYAKHGVNIPDEKFQIVGRPQVAGILPADEASTDRQRTVLYAPTWTGHQASTNYCSLVAGDVIVAALLAVNARVIFRPHPYSRQHAGSRAAIARIHGALKRHSDVSGTQHLFGPAASRDLDLVGCFNASDALVTDVSSVPADYLLSGKPFLITNTKDQPLDEFTERFPLVLAAYVVNTAQPQDLDGLLTQMLGADPMRAARERMRTYYLGDFDRERYADAFIDAVRDMLANVAPVLGSVNDDPQAERIGNIQVDDPRPDPSAADPFADSDSFVGDTLDGAEPSQRFGAEFVADEHERGSAREAAEG